MAIHRVCSWFRAARAAKSASANRLPHSAMVRDLRRAYRAQIETSWSAVEQAGPQQHEHMNIA